MKLFLTHKPDLHMYSINMILLLSRPLGIQANPDDFFVNSIENSEEYSVLDIIITSIYISEVFFLSLVVNYSCFKATLHFP